MRGRALDHGIGTYIIRSLTTRYASLMPACPIPARRTALSQRAFPLSPPQQTIVEVLLASGQGPLYLIGGFIRDALLGLEPSPDLDLALAHHSPQTCLALGRRYRWQGFVMDADRQHVRLLRKTDPSAPERPSYTVDIAPLAAGDIMADLQLRDCTVNAMALEVARVADGHAYGAFWDPFGGQDDLAAGQLRPVAWPNILRDPVRMVRMVRLAHTRRLRLPTEAAAYLRAHRSVLAQASPERIREEGWLILSHAGRDVSLALQLLERTGLYAYTFFAADRSPRDARDERPDAWAFMDRVQALAARNSPALRESFAWRQLPGALQHAFQALAEAPLAARRPRRHWWMQIGLMALPWLVWPRDASAPAWTAERQAQYGRQLDAYLAHQRFSRVERDFARSVTQAMPRLLSLATQDGFDPTDRKRLHRFIMEAGWIRGTSVCLDVLVLWDAAWDLAAVATDEAGVRLRVAAAALLDLLSRARLQKPQPLVTGADLHRWFGLAPGPRVGRLLRLVLEAEACRLIATPEDAKRYLNDLL